MSELRKALTAFRSTVHREASRSQPPTLRMLWDRERPTQTLQLRWAAITLAVLFLAAIPVYRNSHQQQRESEQERADTLLLQQVNSALSRSVPRAMAPLAMVLDVQRTEESQ